MTQGGLLIQYVERQLPMPQIFIRAGAIRASIRVYISYFISLIIYYTDINTFFILQTDVGLNEEFESIPYNQIVNLK